ncbi:MAG: transglutaminase domain-containing protein [Candidatus Marinimicrobia bacterium]|nr:transglutaminase domain-containing protein [Candidatus Neomarinimicrobiota bacterium]
MITKKTVVLGLYILFCSCQSHVNITENVQDILNKSGGNKAELKKVIRHFQHPEDSLKLKAAYFLIGNMEMQSYAHFIVVDSAKTDMHFNVLDYLDYEAMIAAWDSIEAIKGEIRNWCDTTIYDYNIITAEYLISNIDLAFKAWYENSWSKHINFDQFCEYILPYRGSNEPIENWRAYFFQKYQWVKDSVKNDNDPVEAAILINNDIKSWFSFDPRFYRQSTDQGLSEMLLNKKGRCEDMTNLALYAMRSMGIPVMSDFTPYWAKTGNNHAWNAIIDKNGDVIIFMGGEANPGKYKLNQTKAKVYRKTFARQANSLAEIKEEWEKAPPYINRNSIVDVTDDYIAVADVNIKLQKEVPDSANFAYICVFNTGEWKAIHWSRISDDHEAGFTDMGLDIAYLPAYYVNEKIVPAGKPFILTETGNLIFLKPDTLNLTSAKLFSTTKRITKNATDNITKAYFEQGLEYELFYWNDKWISVGKQKASHGALDFMNIPTNALYWLLAENSREEERIFTIDKNGKQVWW